MFSVLNLQEHISQGFWEKLTGWIKRNPGGAELIKSGPVRYWEVKWEQRGSRPVPWGQIQELARWAPAGILLPKGVQPPDGVDLPLVPGEGLQRYLLQEAAVAAVGASRAEPLKMSVAVFDPDGRLGSLAVRFLPYAATVKVITQNPEQLLDAQRQAMVEYGAALLITDEPDAARDCPVAVATEGLPEGYEGGDQVLFSLEKRRPSPPGLSVAGCVARLREDCAAACPSFLDPEQFAAALFVTRQCPGGYYGGDCRLSDGRRMPAQQVGEWIAACVRQESKPLERRA